jgi:uncharacterized protein YbaP (TraB family)
MLSSIRINYFFALFLFLCSNSFAQHSNSLALHPPRHPESPVSVQPSQSILWKITKDGQSHSSYLYAIPPKVPRDFFFLPEGLQELIQSSEKLIMEVNPGQSNMDYLHRGAVPMDSTLDVILPKRRYQEIEKFIDDHLSPKSMDKLKNRYSPKDLSQQMLSDYCLGFRDDSKPVDYEFFIHQVAKKPLKTLNTGWTRAAWQEDFSVWEQTENLIQTYENRDSLCSLYKEYLMAYRRQDLDAFWLLSKEIPQFGDNHNQMIEVRNKRWLESLRRQLQFEDNFIVVNAVQLPGEYGLLHQLRKAGYTVTPVQKNIPKYKHDPERYAFPKLQQKN